MKPISSNFRLTTISTVVLVCISIAAAIELDLFREKNIPDANSVSNFLKRVWPPDYSELWSLLPLLSETLVLAFWGTLLGTGVGLVLTLLIGDRGMRASKYFSSFVHAAAVVSRSIPDLLLAFSLVAILGIGPLAGILALAISSIGMTLRISTQRVDSIPQIKSDGFASLGYRNWQSRISYLAQEIWSQFLATASYRFDINLRASIVIGLAGAGGVGVALRLYFGSLDYSKAIAVVSIIAIFLVFVEFVVSRIRHKSNSDSQRNRGKQKKLAKYIFFSLTGTLLILGLLNAIAEANFSSKNFAAFGVALINPDFSTHRQEIFGEFLESILLASIATFFGILLALFVGIAAARTSNLGWISYFIARLFLVVKRSIPTIIFAIIFVVMFGPGPMAGLAALILGVGGIGAKFIADSLEELPHKSLLALQSLGLSKLQYIFSGLLRVNLSTLIGNFAYMFELNIRYSTVLGLVGAGGLGTLISGSIRSNDFGTAVAILYLVAGFLIIFDILSRRVLLQFR